MSVFTVTLNNSTQGALDVYPVSGVMTQAATSLQRTIYIMGPHRVNRKLADGQTFTDSNYYKRFCAYDATTNPGGETDPAKVILTCTTDDGSVWDDAEGGSGSAPMVFAFDATDGVTGGWSGTPPAQGAGGLTYADNTLNILAGYGGYARFCEIQNLNATNGDSLQVRLNGSSDAVLTIAAGDHQIFDRDDLLISKIELAAAGSGATTLTAQVIIGLSAQSNS